jgi:hypothetical protein
MARKQTQLRLTPRGQCILRRQNQLCLICTVAASPHLQLQSSIMECIPHRQVDSLWWAGGFYSSPFASQVLEAIFPHSVSSIAKCLHRMPHLLENKFAMHSSRWQPFFAFDFAVEVILRQCYRIQRVVKNRFPVIPSHFWKFRKFCWKLEKFSRNVVDV